MKTSDGIQLGTLYQHRGGVGAKDETVRSGPIKPMSHAEEMCQPQGGTLGWGFKVQGDFVVGVVLALGRRV